MRRLMPLSGLLLFCGFSAPFAQTESHSRGYSWGFEHGSLIPNWSFENDQDFWVDNTVAGEYTVQTHYKTPSVTGSFCARVNGYFITTASQGRLISKPFRLEGGTSYSLSFYYKTGSVTGVTVPYIMLSSSNFMAFDTVFYGGIYTYTSTWQPMVINFTAPVEVQFAQIVMAGSGGPNPDGGEFFFDDVVLEEGGYFTVEDIVARRARISETVGFGDAFGRSPQTQTKLSASNYLVGGGGYDGFARPETTFLATPYYGIAPGFRNDLVTQANSFYGPSGPFDAHGAAFSRVLYADEPSPRVVEMGAPDTAWALGHAHTVKSGFYYRNDYTIPSNIQSPGVDATAREFRLSWTKGADSTYTLTWTNRLGQVVRTSTNLTKSASGADTWTWSHTMPDYYRMGQARRIRTPLDVQANDSTFAEINEYDARGQVISTWSKTKGLTRFWYNKLGQLRYSQDSGQAAAGQYTYSDYDKLGRLRAKGIKNGGTLTQAIVDLDTTTGTKYEKVGYIYDDLSTFQARTGKTLSQLVPHNSYLPTGNSWGRLVCAYNRNDDLISSPFTELDRFVVECYGYDARGNRTTTLKSIHPIRDPVKKFQDAYFNYDEQNRLVQAFNFTDYSTGGIPAMTVYTYDMQGRVASANGPTGLPAAQFAYCDWGPVCSVTLGGDGTGTQGTRIDYAYHPRGGVKSIKATNLTAGTITFEEFLGYESKSYNDASVPAPLKAKYDGTITQMLYHFASDVNAQKPVRLVNYDYDQLGRMLKADDQKNSSANPFLSSGAISFPVSWTNGTESDSKVAYDLNGRITGQRTGNISAGDSAVYIYNTGTYKLNRVTGKVNEVVTRNMSTTNNFVYDARGNMTQDKSKTTQLNIVYGWDKMPVTFAFTSLGPKTTYTFYDAGGNRVSAIDKISATYVYGRHYINMGPGLSREWNETYSGSGPTITGTAHTVNLYAHAQVGRVTPGGEYEYFVKNHLGSTMKTVGQNGNEPTGGGTDYDYLAYGDLRKLKENASPVTQKYTRKEYEDLSRLYYFGARFYDPELGIWITPDAYGEFFNPYGRSGDPINFVDRDGNCEFICIAIIVGATIGAYYGGSKANDDWNPIDWDYTNVDTYTYMAAGAVVGGAIGGGAAFIGAAAGGAAISGLGLSSTSTAGILASSTIAGVVSGGLAGMGNAWAFGGGLEAGFFEGSWDEVWRAGVAGAALGGALGFASGATQVWSKSISEGIVKSGLNTGAKQFGVEKGGYAAANHFFPKTMQTLTTGLAAGIKGASPLVLALGTHSSALTDIYAVNGGPLPNDPLGRSIGRWANFSGGARYAGSPCYSGGVSVNGGGVGGSGGVGSGPCQDRTSERDFFRPNNSIPQPAPIAETPLNYQSFSVFNWY